MHTNLQKLSYSAQTLLEACPRLYELDRLSPRLSLEGEDVHMDFGQLVGKLVQNYLTDTDYEKAVWNAFLSYPRSLFSDSLDEVEEEKKHKKDFWFAMHALDKFKELRATELSSYTVPIFQGKPATELGFLIDCGEGFQYRGKLDALLVNKEERYAGFECKTTGSNFLHEAMFRNSGQGIGYSAVIDAVASSLGLQQRASFPIFYPVYQSRQLQWTMFPFIKSRASHANWIRHLLRSIQHISEYSEDGYFPMHGQSCFHYNRPCRFFEACEMQNKHLVGDERKIIVKEDKEGEYPFRFSLDELIAAQMEKISS